MKKTFIFFLLCALFVILGQTFALGATFTLTNARDSYDRPNNAYGYKAYHYNTGDTVNFTFTADSYLNIAQLYVRSAADQNGANIMDVQTIYNINSNDNKSVQTVTGSITLPATTADHYYNTYCLIILYYLQTSPEIARECRAYIIKDPKIDQAFDSVTQFPNGKIYIRGWIMQFEPTYNTRVRIYRGTSEADDKKVWEAKTTHSRPDAYRNHSQYQLETTSYCRFGFFLEIHEDYVKDFTIGEYTVIVDALNYNDDVIRSYKYPNNGSGIPSMEANNGYKRAGEFHVYAPRKHFFNDQQVTYTAAYGSTVSMYCTGDDIDSTTPAANDTYVWYQITDSATTQVATGRSYSPPTNLNVGTYTYICRVTTTYTGKGSYNTSTVSGGAGGSGYNKIGTYTGSRTSQTPTITYTVTRKGIAKPSAVTGLIYNGSVQTGAPTGTGYSYTSGTLSATDAGSYSVTATLGSNYQWSDNTTTAYSFTWSIARKSITITANDQTITYGDPLATGTDKVKVETLASGDYLSSVSLDQSISTAGSGNITPSAAIIKEESTDVTNNYSISYINGNLTIKKKELTPHATANGKTYDTTTNILQGTLYVEGILGTDMVELKAKSFAFDSPLPGNRTAVATGLYLIGTDKDNYVLKTDTCSVPASISPYGTITASCISPYINTAEAVLLQNAVQNVLPFTLPGGCTYKYGKGTFGTATTDYIRIGDYYDALGKLADTFSLNILIDGITVVYGNMNVTTGTNTVYGDNQYTENVLLSSSILKFDTPWTTDASHNASIKTNAPTNVTFLVYLRQGEKLNVGTKIGLYYGRVDITVKKGESEQAKDKIDAFFPVSYEEEYTISNMHSSRVQNEINPNRGDYWSAVPEFTASEDGLYSVTMHVTGSSYLLDAQKGLGAMYQGNTPADPPETSLRYISIQS